MTEAAAPPSLDHRLLQLGWVLFLLGLLTGFVVPAVANPRMALSSHLEGVQNGILLLVLGAIWGRLHLSPRAERVAFGLAVYGTYVNWATTLAAAVWGAGGAMMPMAARGHSGTPAQELFIRFGLVSLSLAMVGVSAMALWGLRRAE